MQPSSTVGSPLSAGSQPAGALPFRRDADDPGFPYAGTVLLLVLLAVACWAWIAGKRGTSRWPQGAAASWRWRLPGAAAEPEQAIRVLSSTRLDVGTRLHVVEWQGRQMLVAVSASAPPVVLDRRAEGHSRDTGITP